MQSNDTVVWIGLVAVVAIWVLFRLIFSAPRQFREYATEAEARRSKLWTVQRGKWLTVLASFIAGATLGAASAYQATTAYYDEYITKAIAMSEAAIELAERAAKVLEKQKSWKDES